MAPQHPAPAEPRVSPAEALARHWITSLVLLTLGLALGVAAAYAMPTTHRAEARLAVAPDSSNAYSIPGFPLAARDLAADYARWVQNDTAGGGLGAEITASPIPDSGVVRIEAEAPTSEAAVGAASQVSKDLESRVAEAKSNRDPQAAYKAYTDLTPKVTAAQGRVDAAERAYGSAVGGNAPTTQVKAAADALAEARIELAELQLRHGAAGDLYRKLYSDTTGVTQLKVIAPAAAVGDNRSALVQRGAVIGLGLGGLTALVAAMMRARRRIRGSEVSTTRADDARRVPTPGSTSDSATTPATVDSGTSRGRVGRFGRARRSTATSTS